MSNIDADALERAAKAAREVERSKYAKEIFRLSRDEQVTKQLEEKRKREEAVAQAKLYEQEREKVRWEEQRKTIEFNAKTQQQLKSQEHDLARQRANEEHERARRRQEELVQLQLQAESKKQAMRRATDLEIQEERRRTDENRAKLERANMESRIAAESKGRIEELRQNQDIHEKHLRVKGELDRVRVKEAINTTFENLGQGLSSFLADRQRLTTTVATLTALAAGIYFTREGMRVAGRLVEKRLGTPSLVRETSRTVGHYALRTRISRAMGFLQESEGFADVVLPSELNTRITRTVKATRNTRRNAAPFRHMLFYGPPGVFVCCCVLVCWCDCSLWSHRGLVSCAPAGTGKTMVAKRLAKSSGMDFAVRSGRGG